MMEKILKTKSKVRKDWNSVKEQRINWTIKKKQKIETLNKAENLLKYLKEKRKKIRWKIEKGKKPTRIKSLGKKVVEKIQWQKSANRIIAEFIIKVVNETLLLRSLAHRAATP